MTVERRSFFVVGERGVWRNLKKERTAQRMEHAIFEGSLVQNWVKESGVSGEMLKKWNLVQENRQNMGRINKFAGKSGTSCKKGL